MEACVIELNKSWSIFCVRASSMYVWGFLPTHTMWIPLPGFNSQHMQQKFAHKGEKRNLHVRN